MFSKNKFLPLMSLTLSLVFSAGYAEKAKTISTEGAKAESEKIDIQKVSEAFGHLIGKNLESLGFDFDISQLIKGLENSIAGKVSPMNETECVQAISLVQEDAFQKLAKNNLEQADSFMDKNAKTDGIIELEKSKLQYKIEKQGVGATVEEHFSPMIRYSGKFLDGKSFGASQEDEMISLDETIPGFTQGIVGMKEGEKRIIYIHPDLGYGTSGYLPPNSTLVFEIEVIKANATPEQENSITSIPNEETREVALPNGKEESVIR